MHKRATPALETCTEPIVNPQYIIPPPPFPPDEELYFRNDAKSKVAPIVINPGPYSDSGSGFSSPICDIIQGASIWGIKDTHPASPPCDEEEVQVEPLTEIPNVAKDIEQLHKDMEGYTAGMMDMMDKERDLLSNVAKDDLKA